MTDFGMARDVHQDDIYTKKSRVGIKLGICKLSGIDTLIKRQMSYSYFIRFFYLLMIIPGKRTWSLFLRDEYTNYNRKLMPSR